jgi:hypothetical protein
LSAKDPPDRGPRLLVEPVACRAGPTPDRWLVAFRLENAGPHPLEILAARLPHGRFRAEERALAPSLRLAPGESALLERCVSCGEPPGTVVENAFLILRLLSRDRPWRLFARLRVTFDPSGTPQPICEAIDIHPIGFSTSQGKPSMSS